MEIVLDPDIRYHLIAFDKDGREQPEENGLYSRVLLETAETREASDVFLFSHGWNGDVPAARRQYGNWLAAMAGCTEDRARAEVVPGGFRPLLVGLHWPSKAWGDEELGSGSFDVRLSAGAADEQEDEQADEQAEGVGDDEIELLVDRFASRQADSPQTRQALRTIIEFALVDPTPATLPAQVREAYRQIDAEAGLGHAGVGAGPGDDREAFDAEAAYQACLLEELTSFGGSSLGGVLSPLRVLTFWQMKRRARAFGESGAAELLTALQKAAPGARFHLMGHSFGCIVASGAVAGAPGRARDRRPVRTLVLVQGAMSLWSFCSSIPARPERQGYFHPIVAEGLVEGAILATTSVHDRAVGVFYPLGAQARRQIDFVPGKLPAYGGIGTFGVCGPGVQIADEQLRPAEYRYDFRPHAAYNLDSDDVIANGSGAMGAHSDICHPAVAHAVWQATTAMSAGFP